MRATLLFTVIALLGNIHLKAQDTARTFTFTDEASVRPDTTKPDSITSAPKRRLLPANMSFVERSLWDENGIFRGIGLASPLTPESRKSELALRRTMLTAHQIGGFVTLGLMGTAVYYGQQALNNPEIRSYRRTHQTFVTATIISYSATGLLSVLSPPPLIRRDEVSTTTIHKTLAWVHFVGMVVTPILGASLRHSMNYDQLARFHQISAYITAATLATSLIVITF